MTISLTISPLVLDNRKSTTKALVEMINREQTPHHSHIQFICTNYYKTLNSPNVI